MKPKLFSTEEEIMISLCSDLDTDRIVYKYFTIIWLTKWILTHWKLYKVT